jgi:hypothetical protein
VNTSRDNYSTHRFAQNEYSVENSEHTTGYIGLPAPVTSHYNFLIIPYIKDNQFTTSHIDLGTVDVLISCVLLFPLPDACPSFDALGNSSFSSFFFEGK